MIKFCFTLIALSICNLQALDSSFKFEGILGAAVESIYNMNSNAQSFIPYNPVIVEIGAYEGAGTYALAHTYPYGKIFAFEPHPQAYDQLVKKVGFLKNVSVINLAVSNIKGMSSLYGEGPTASLLPIQNEQPQIVPTCILDDWSKEQGIEHIDFLRLDAQGHEWKILQSAPNILKTVIVIITKTYMKPSIPSILPYSILKKQLENAGFELLSHWYQEGKEGEATFIRKYMYDALFR